jgi:CheY-like chemotaxis protein
MKNMNKGSGLADNGLLAGKTILIADDEAFVRSHISKRLGSIGLTVLEASTGREVLDLMVHNPDMVLMDVRMPEIDGYETTRFIRKESAGSNIPVILLSALSGEEDIRRGLEAGADEFLCKPVTFTMILESLNRRIKARQAG